MITIKTEYGNKSNEKEEQLNAGKQRTAGWCEAVRSR